MSVGCPLACGLTREIEERDKERRREGGREGRTRMWGKCVVTEIYVLI